MCLKRAEQKKSLGCHSKVVKLINCETTLITFNGATKLYFKHYSCNGHYFVQYGFIEVCIFCNWTRTQNHLVRKRTLNHLAKLTVCIFYRFFWESSFFFVFLRLFSLRWIGFNVIFINFTTYTFHNNQCLQKYQVLCVFVLTSF